MTQNRFKVVCINPTKQLTKGKNYWAEEVKEHSSYTWVLVTYYRVINNAGYNVRVSPSRFRKV